MLAGFWGRQEGPQWASCDEESDTGRGWLARSNPPSRNPPTTAGARRARYTLRARRAGLPPRRARRTRSIAQPAQLGFERLLERRHVRRGRLVTLLCRREAEPAELIHVPNAGLAVTEPDAAADQRPRSRDGVDDDRHAPARRLRREPGRGLRRF